MSILKTTTVPKSQSENRYCNVTNKWQEANEVIQLKVQNGGRSTIDEIPGGGIVKKRVATKEKLIQEKRQSISTLSSASITLYSPDTSISSSHSYEGKHIIQQRGQKPQVLFKRNDKNSSVLSNPRSESPKILKLDIKGRLVILSKGHRFLEKIKSERQRIPQSYRSAIRIDNLTDEELEDLNKNYANKVITVGNARFKV